MLPSVLQASRFGEVDVEEPMEPPVLPPDRGVCGPMVFEDV